MNSANKAVKKARSILVIDDAPFSRETTMAALTANGFLVHAVGDGAEGVRLLEQIEADLVILDFEMRHLSGIEFLKILRSCERWKSLPVLMLTNNISLEAVTQAARYGVRGYMVKSKFSVPLLLARVNAALSPQARPAMAAAVETEVKPSVTVSRETMLEAVAELVAAKTLSGVVSELVAISNSPQCNLSDISGALRHDPVLTARTLQVAGSPAYGAVKGKLTDVADAVRILGASGVREIALSVGVFEAFVGDGKLDLDVLRCWEHAFAVAGVMRRIVPRHDGVSADMPYLIGLCHDLGEIILRQRFPDGFAAAAELAAQSGKPLDAGLKAVFDVSYAELVESLFSRLTLPEAIGKAIRDCAQLWDGRENNNPLAHALAIANQCAHGLLMTPCAESVVSPVPWSECRAWTLNPAQINGAEVRAEAITVTCAVAKIPSGKQRELRQPVVPAMRGRIGYVRHANFAALDPLELALENLCNVELFSQIPKGEDLSGIQGLVIAHHGPEAAAKTGGLRTLKISRGISLARLSQFLQSV